MMHVKRMRHSQQGLEIVATVRDGFITDAMLVQRTQPWRRPSAPIRLWAAGDYKPSFARIHAAPAD